jgi:WhiB family redox-sensing transcriptional regulator
VGQIPKIFFSLPYKDFSVPLRGENSSRVHLRSIHRMDWRDNAACLTADPELFFPVGNTGPAVDQIEKAKAVCGRCTVSEMCLQYALDTNQDSGVWGGLSEDERRALKRRAARARRAS